MRTLDLGQRGHRTCPRSPNAIAFHTPGTHTGGRKGRMGMVCSFLLLWARLGTGVIGMNQVLLCPHGALSQAEATAATQGSWPRSRGAGCHGSLNGAPDPAWKTQAGFLEEEEPSKLKPRSCGSLPDEGQRGVPRRACPCPPHCRPLRLRRASPLFDQDKPYPGSNAIPASGYHAISSPVMPALLSFPERTFVSGLSRLSWEVGLQPAALPGL